MEMITNNSWAGERKRDGRPGGWKKGVEASEQGRIRAVVAKGVAVRKKALADGTGEAGKNTEMGGGAVWRGRRK